MKNVSIATLIRMPLYVMNAPSIANMDKKRIKTFMRIAFVENGLFILTLYIFCHKRKNRGKSDILES